jgi:aspartyl protease family protein
MWGPERRPERRALSWLGGLLLGLGMIVLGPGHRRPAAPADQAAAPAPTAQLAATNEPYNPWGKDTVSPMTHQVVEPRVLTRDESGQFHLNVTVNGRDIRFLVDTGADLVALTPQTAQDVGLNVLPGDYQPVLRTASGMGMGAVVSLDSVELVGRRLEHQRAVVAQGLSENLLGQSVLRHLGRVELKGDTMVLVPN